MSLNYVYHLHHPQRWTTARICNPLKLKVPQAKLWIWNEINPL